MSSDRTNNFDGLRLIGALMVFYSHQFALAGHAEPTMLNGDIKFGMFASYLVNLVSLRFDNGGAFFPDNPQRMLYGPMWTIPTEVHCYLLLLAAGMLFGKRLGALITGVAILLLLQGALSPLIGDDLVVTFALHGWRWPVSEFGAFFLAGCMLCFHESLRARAWLPIVGGLVLIARGQELFGLALAMPAAAVYVGSRSWPILRSAGRFGDLSYGVYLWAWPVQQTLVMVLGKSTPLWVLMPLSLLGTLACALASWHLVEKPAMRLKPSRPRSLPAAEPAPIELAPLAERATSSAA